MIVAIETECVDFGIVVAIIKGEDIGYFRKKETKVFERVYCR